MHAEYASFHSLVSFFVHFRVTSTHTHRDERHDTGDSGPRIRRCTRISHTESEYVMRARERLERPSKGRRKNYLFSGVNFDRLHRVRCSCQCVCRARGNSPNKILIYFASATFSAHEMRSVPMCHLVVKQPYQCFVVILTDRKMGLCVCLFSYFPFRGRPSPVIRVPLSLFGVQPKATQLTHARIDGILTFFERATRIYRIRLPFAI